VVKGNVTLKRLDVWSFAKINAILGLIWGLIYGILMAIWFSWIGVMSNVTTQNISTPATFFAGLGVFMIIIGPIMGVICGLISGIITAFLYNIAAGWVGGIKMKFE
jgi:hypothetical protein